ncbi:MAG: ATP synthase subunit C [Synergistaceae bacterium]|jgi:V/A-type H+-transporting ATPase subunit K|nr:ATP synthase subunit C [Synergistaceae bacterium]
MFGLILSVTAVLGTIVAGVSMRRAGFRGSKKLFACAVALSCLTVLAGAAFVILSAPAMAADAPGGIATASPESSSSNGMGFIGMALATGLACIGAGIAVGSVGSAAIGLVGEQPGAIGTTLIYVGLAEGVAIYGIVISMLIFNKLA